MKEVKKDMKNQCKKYKPLDEQEFLEESLKFFRNIATKFKNEKVNAQPSSIKQESLVEECSI